jgi:hypothetical protein
MKSLKILFLLYFVLSLNLSYAQDTSRFRKYVQFLRTSDSKSQNHLFTIGYNYSFMPIYKTFNTQGGIFSFGLNLARFFNTKHVFGFTFDLKLVKGFSKKKLSQNYINDFNSSITVDSSSSYDFENAKTIKQAIDGYSPSNKGAALQGNQIFNFGVMFSLFPQKKGGVMIQLKKGITSMGIYNIKNPNIGEGISGQRSAIWFSQNFMGEVIFKPFAFVRNTFVDKDFINQTSHKPLFNLISVSLYYQRFDHSMSSFYGTDFSTITNPIFLNKYHFENQFGAKIGFSFY